MIFASFDIGGDRMLNTELPTIYLIAASFSSLTLCVLLLASRMTKLLRTNLDLQNKLQNAATKDDIHLANKKLDTDLVNAMLLFENNITQRSEELLAEVIGIRTTVSKLRATQPNSSVDEAKYFDNKFDDVIAFAREGLSSEEISARLNLKHAIVQDIIQFRMQN
jgi:hypothetical protein